MKSLKFSDSDISSMRQFYENELNKTLSHLEHLKSILDQLGDAPKVEINVASSGSSVAAAVPVVKRGPGRPPNPNTKKRKKSKRPKWGNFIVNLLRRQAKPIPYSHLILEAMEKYKIPEERYKNVQQAILNSSFRLRKEGNKIRTFSIQGEKGKHVALSKWFDGDGQLMPEFAAKINLVPTKITTDADDQPAAAPAPAAIAATTAAPEAAPKRKRGRPRKQPLIPSTTAAAPAPVAQKPAAAPAPAAPKRRGRPPKSATAAVPAPAAKKPTPAATPAAPKRRGRPPKSATAAVPPAKKAAPAKKPTAAKKATPAKKAATPKKAAAKPVAKAKTAAKKPVAKKASSGKTTKVAKPRSAKK